MSLPHKCFWDTVVSLPHYMHNQICVTAMSPPQYMHHERWDTYLPQYVPWELGYSHVPTAIHIPWMLGNRESRPKVHTLSVLGYSCKPTIVYAQWMPGYWHEPPTVHAAWVWSSLWHSTLTMRTWLRTQVHYTMFNKNAGLMVSASYSRSRVLQYSCPVPIVNARLMLSTTVHAGMYVRPCHCTRTMCGWKCVTPPQYMHIECQDTTTSPR